MCMENEYVIITIKTTGDNPYLDTVSRVGLIRYKDHIELTRSAYYVKKEAYGFDKTLKGVNPENILPLDQVREAVANIINGKLVIGFGQPYFLQKMLEDCYKEVHFSYLDCKEYIGKVVPPLAGYSFERLIDFFMLFEKDESPCTECSYIHRMYMAVLRLSRGRFMHELSPNAERYLSGYWVKKAEPDRYAKLAMFDKKNVLVTGRFKTMSRETICGIISTSGGIVQEYPDKNTNVVIAGNSEFPAVYQTHSFHEALSRIKYNQEIRIISELEMLALLYGQINWNKEVNSSYVPVTVEPEFLEFSFVPKMIKEGFTRKVHVTVQKKADSWNNRGNRKITAKKILDVIRGSASKS